MSHQKDWNQWERKDEMSDDEKNPLSAFTTGELQEELKRRESKLSEEYKKAVEVIKTRFECAPLYITNSPNAHKLDDAIFALNLVEDNWNNPEAWSYSDMCW